MLLIIFYRINNIYVIYWDEIFFIVKALTLAMLASDLVDSILTLAAKVFGSILQRIY